MSRMCQSPGCPQLACMRVSIEDVGFEVCLQHGRKVREAAPEIKRQLQQHEHGAKCEGTKCEGKPATAQLKFGPTWVNLCDPCRADLAGKLKILRNGQAPEQRPLKTFYKAAPPVSIVEDP